LIEIVPAVEPEQLDRVRALFTEYQRWLNVDLCFQDFERELAGLPGAYGPPLGAIYLAAEDGAVAGCAALRPLDPEVGEMKRLYVRPDFRGRGVGRLLAERVIAAARRRRFVRLRLDTLRFMDRAIGLYESLGFVDIPPYYHNPLEGSRFLELDLKAAGGDGAG
jgi:ribosomal protein S18 acetylase RimI-like enzyme